MKIAEQFASHLVATKAEDIPSGILEVGKACLLDTCGVALLGCQEPLVDILCDVTNLFGGNAQASIIGRSSKASIPDAALINGASAHALDYDDMHLASGMHPSAPVICAALSVAEFTGASGNDFLRAVILGLETCTRLGEVMNPYHYDRGWHTTGTLGHFGAAVSAATLLGLNASQMTVALGLAATQSAGLKETFGTMAKPFHAGHAARDGVISAYLALKGFTCTSTMLEGKVGYGKVMGEAPDWQHLLTEWGNRWSTEKILYKPHVSSFCTQALIEGVLELREQHSIGAEHVREIRGFVSEMSMKNATIAKPKTGMEGKFSLPFAASLALVQGSATKQDFCDERANDPVIENIRSLTKISAGVGVKWPQAIVEIDTTSGQQFKTFVDLEKRMETAEQKWQVSESKFRRICTSLLDATDIDRIVNAIQTIDTASNLSDLTSLIATRRLA